MNVPDWWAFLLLALAAYRVWRLLAEDAILDRPRRKLTRLGSAWQKEGDPVPEGYRAEWAKFLLCPWCLGFWVSLAWWAAWQASEKWALVACTPFALSAAVGMIRVNLDPPED